MLWNKARRPALPLDSQTYDQPPARQNLAYTAALQLVDLIINQV